MRILVITRNPWDDTNSIGNTLSNFFRDINNVEFANVYFRSAKPNNQLCKHYFCVTEVDVLKKWFCPSKIGKEFNWNYNENLKQSTIAANREKKLIRFIQRHSFKIAYRISDFIWYSQKWINGNLKDFVQSFNPDVVFTFVKASPQYYLTIKYLRENFEIPIFSWIADDEYTGYLRRNAAKEIENLKSILDSSSVVRGCSVEICNYYNSIFNCNALPLYKGCNLSTPVKGNVNEQIKIVYAGNLLYGRLDIVYRIAQAVERYSVNNHGKHIFFDIYSNTMITDEQIKIFCNKKYVNYKGKQEYKTIVQELEDADVVLYVESFDPNEILKTKYSFSTKIIDCLQSGSVLLAVGPEEIASINYVKGIPGAFVIKNLEELEPSLKTFFDETDCFFARANQIREFAQKYHDSTANSKIVTDILKSLKEEKL